MLPPFLSQQERGSRRLREEPGERRPTRVQKDPDSANSSHPPPAQQSGAAPGAGAAPLHSRIHSDAEGQEGPRGGLGCSQGWKCPGASLTRVAVGDLSVEEHVTSTPSFPPRLRPHLSVSGEACSAPSRALPVAVLGNRVGPRQKGPEARPGAFPSSPPPRLGGGEQLQLSQAPGNQPPRTLAPATSQPGRRRLHPTREAGSERTGSAGSWAPDSLSLEAKRGSATSLWCARVSQGAGSSRLRPGPRPCELHPGIRTGRCRGNRVAAWRRVSSLRSADLRPDVLYPFPTLILGAWRVEVTAAHHRGAESLSTTGENGRDVEGMERR